MRQTARTTCHAYDRLQTISHELGRTYVRHGLFRFLCHFDRIESEAVIDHARALSCGQASGSDPLHSAADPRFLVLPFSDDAVYWKVWSCRPVRLWTSALSARGVISRESGRFDVERWKIYHNFMASPSGSSLWMSVKKALDSQRRLARKWRCSGKGPGDRARARRVIWQPEKKSL